MKNTIDTNVMPLSIGTMEKVNQVVEALSSANTTLLNASVRSKPLSTLAFSEFYELMDSYLDMESTPDALRETIEHSLSLIQSGAAPFAIQLDLFPEPCRNDANGNDHYRLSISFLDEQGNVLLELRSLFVESRDIDGWCFDPAYMPSAFTVVQNGLLLTQKEVESLCSSEECDYSIMDTAVSDFLRHLRLNGSPAVFPPAPHKISAAQVSLAESIEEFAALSKALKAES
jgi:hypothetical protein